MTAYSNEEWRDIQGFEGLYQVSNLGRVRSLTHTVVFENGRKRTAFGRILSTKAFGKGRPRAHLHGGEGAEWYYVHRLVAIAFCDGYFEGAVVNHKDDNIFNNRADNLEWCTQSYNIKYSYRDGRREGEENRGIGALSKAVSQLTMQGRHIMTYKSINEAARATGLYATNICAVCNGKRNQSGGYKWQFAI